MNIEQRLIECGIEPSTHILQLLKGEVQSLKVPSKTQKKLERTSKKKLQAVHEDMDVARELCLLMLSNFSNTFNRSLCSDDPRIQMGYKRLYSPLLKNQMRYDKNITSPYTAVLKLLIEEGIIERGKKYSTSNATANEYRLTKTYFGKGIVRYDIVSPVVLRMQVREFNQNFERAISTHIGRNSLRLRSRVSFLSDENIERLLEQAIVEGYTNKKGKRLIRLGKHSKKEYPESQYIYMEEYLEQYKYLRDILVVPIVSEQGAEARIVDCFNLMPSLIRKHLKLNGQAIVESDYRALHPNIVQHIYGGSNTQEITHERVAEYLGVEREVAKKEHLSFFNKEWQDMYHSPLFAYYTTHEPRMMQQIYDCKMRSGYKRTSQRLFKLETQLMEEIVGILSNQGVDVIYVFDALYSSEKDKEVVVDIMQKVARNHRILSTAQ